MIVAHGTWLPTRHRFFVWGESEPAVATADGADHPYHLACEDVERQLLDALSDGETRFEIGAEEITLLLPSENGFPLPSPEHHFHRDMPSSLERHLRGWRIYGLSLTPESALAWLAMLPASDELLPQRMSLGTDLRYWSSAARFALELLARQRFLPAMVTDNGHAEAFWEPLVEEELDRVEALRSAMPAVW